MDVGMWMTDSSSDLSEFNKAQRVREEIQQKKKIDVVPIKHFFPNSDFLYDALQYQHLRE